MTGRVPNRHGLHRPPVYGEPGGLQGEITIAQLLSDAGYVTQAVVVRLTVAIQLTRLMATRMG
jgi:arylsulfatase A-like enzyme